MLQYLQKLFGATEAEAKASVSLYEVKQYTNTGLQNTWYATAVHETAHGYTFLDKQTGNAVVVSGDIKITGFVPGNEPVTQTPASDQSQANS